MQAAFLSHFDLYVVELKGPGAPELQLLPGSHRNPDRPAQYAEIDWQPVGITLEYVYVEDELAIHRLALMTPQNNHTRIN